MKLSPSAFEQLVIDLLSKMGYGAFENAGRITKATGDEGIDGVIMEDNLKYAGKEIKWLTNEIRKQGCSSPDKVFLCIVDGNDKVTVFPKTQESNKKIYFD